MNTHDTHTHTVDHSVVTEHVATVAPLGPVKTEAGNNISWRSVFAGVVTFIALSILFSLIGTAIGLGMTDLTAANPLDGVGLGVVLWTLFSLIVTLAAGGFVAGLTANRAGYIHGFLSWALSLIAVVFLATSALGSAFNAVGNVLGFAGRQAANVASTAGDAVASLSESAFTAVSENLSIDTTDLEANVVEVLENTDIAQLQPNYLQAQLDATVTDIQDAARAIVIEGQPADQVFNNVYTNIEDRLAAIGEGLNEEEIKAAIAENSELTQAEVDAAYNNIQESYTAAQENAQELLAQAEQQLQDLSAQAQQTAEEVVETTNDVMNATSKYAIYAFIGLVLAAVLTSFAGYYGAQKGLVAKFQ